MQEQDRKKQIFSENTKEAHFLHSLKAIFNNAKESTISIGSLFEQLKDEGLLFLIALIALPAAFPIPTPPGFTTLIGVPLCFLTIQLIFKRDQLWLPNWIMRKKIKISTFRDTITKIEPVMNKLTLLLRPRYKRFTTRGGEKVAGVVAFLCSVSVALPILFGNAVPSAAVLILALGLLYEDGLAIVIGTVIGIIGICISSAVVFLTAFLGWAAIEKIYNKLSIF